MLTEVTVDRAGVVPPDTYVIGVLTDGQQRWRGESLAPTQGQLAWNFVVPDDAVPTALDITMLDGSIPIRLQL